MSKCPLLGRWTHPWHQVNTSSCPEPEPKIRWKNKKWEKTLKHIPNILTKQMDISMFIYIYKTNIYIYIHVHNHTNIKSPSFVVVLGQKHHDILHRAAVCKIPLDCGVNKLVPETSFIPAKWWKHSHDSPCPYSFPGWGQVRRLFCLELYGGGGSPNAGETHVVLR